MKVSNSPAFGSKILYCAKLKENNFWKPPKDIDVYISELEKNDINTIQNINPILLNTNHGKHALHSFSDKYNANSPQLALKQKFIVVELKEALTADKYLGIAELYDGKNVLIVKRLQSLRCMPIYANIKGIGSCMMYAILNMAQSLRKGAVELTAACGANGFYRKIGMAQDICNFKIGNSQFEEVAKIIQNKFDIKK